MRKPRPTHGTRMKFPLRPRTNWESRDIYFASTNSCCRYGPSISPPSHSYHRDFHGREPSSSSDRVCLDSRSLCNLTDNRSIEALSAHGGSEAVLQFHDPRAFEPSVSSQKISQVMTTIRKRPYFVLLAEQSHKRIARNSNEYRFPQVECPGKESLMAAVKNVEGASHRHFLVPMTLWQI